MDDTPWGRRPRPGAARRPPSGSAAAARLGPAPREPPESLPERGTSGRDRASQREGGKTCPFSRADGSSRSPPALPAWPPPAGSPGLGLPDLLGAERPGDEIRQIPTYCDICFWKCGAIATTRNGRLWKIEGNPEDPLSSGRLCPRGSGGVGAHYDPNRLTAPLVRRRERGEEVWAEVTWGEALDRIAEKMLAIRAEHGPEAMALFSHGIGGTFLKHAMKAFGTPNLTAPSYAQCRGPRDVGFNLTFGEGVSTPERTDIRNARCLVLIGSHLGENMHNTQVQEFAEAVGSGARIIVVDPRFSVAASKADWYLPIKPGTDIALLLAWMNVLVGEELYDREYVDAHGFGFDAFAAEIAPYTPEWAYAEDRYRAGGDPRDGARDGATPSGDPGAPGSPRHLVRRRRPAQPRHRAAQRPARQLGPQGRLLVSGEHGRAGLGLPAVSEAGAAQGGQPRQEVPLRRRRPDHRHPRTRPSPASPIPSRAGWSTRRICCRRCQTSRRRSRPSRSWICWWWST